MDSTLIYCHDREMFDAVAKELTDWKTEYIVRPQALEFVLPQSHITGVHLFLAARHIRVENITFYTTTDGGK